MFLKTIKWVPTKKKTLLPATLLQKIVYNILMCSKICEKKEHTYTHTPTQHR